jgi:hypothetical protein
MLRTSGGMKASFAQGPLTHRLAVPPLPEGEGTEFHFPLRPLDTSMGRGLGFIHANARGPIPGRSGALLSREA